MKRYFIHHAVFRILAPAFYGALVYLIVLMINNAVSQVNDIFNSYELYLCIGTTYLVFECNRIIVWLVSKTGKQLKASGHIAVQIVSTTFVSTGLAMVCFSLYFQYMLGFSMTETQFMIFATIFVITALLYNLLYLSDYYLQKENTIKLQTEIHHKEILEMEMLEFQHDINPDLLYESLENLIGIMYRDVEKGEDYIDSLASAYRYVLTNRQHELITVQQEIEAGKNLLKLLNEKYFGQLRFETSLDEDTLQASLIPGSLPILIESIVRNSIITRYEAFTISCYREDEYLVLQSKLNDRLMLYPGSDVAFARMQRSYSLYSELPLIKVKAYQENYIKLPILQVEEITSYA